MKKRNIIFALLLISVITTAFGVSKTYARYITEDDGSATATIAKWHAEFKDGNTALTDNFTLVLEENSDYENYVVEGKIAPDTGVYKDLTVDISGTEVATEVTLKLDSIDTTNVLGNAGRFDVIVSSVDDETVTKLTPAGDGTYTLVAGTSFDKSAYTTDDNVTFRVEVVWYNDEDQNEYDTKMGENAYDTTTTGDDVITANVTLTAKQVIATPANIAEPSGYGD